MKRRNFLKASAATLAYFCGGHPLKACASSAFAATGGLPPLDGELLVDPAACAAMAEDFGHFVHRQPSGVLLPRSAEDIRKIVSYAFHQKLKITGRGHSCSAYGQAQADQGLVVNTEHFNKIVWAAADCIDVEPGCTWHEVVSFALTRGMAPAVFPDTLFLTVGGTLSAGGIGETSYRLGGMVDHVVELDVITGQGDFVTCSPQANGELFEAVLAGMGQCGLIVRARIRLVPAAPRVETRLTGSADAASLLSELSQLAVDPAIHALSGSITRNAGSWNFSAAATSFGRAGNVRFEDYLNRNTKNYRDAIANGSYFLPHPYLSFFVTESAALPLIDDLVNDSKANLGAGAIAVLPMFTRNFKLPLQRLPDASLVYHIRIYRRAAREGSPEHLEMLRVNREELLPRILSEGGTVYPPHSPVLTSAQWQQHFGRPAWASFSSAKQKFDPGGLFTPGAGMF